jgi:hypothetical protein
VLPPKEDGSKAPDSKEWLSWQRQRPISALIEHYYRNGRTGIGYVTGRVSGRVAGLALEVLDFDEYAIWEAYYAQAVAVGLGPLVNRILAGYGERSPHGFHL